MTTATVMYDVVTGVSVSFCVFILTWRVGRGRGTERWCPATLYTEEDDMEPAHGSLPSGQTESLPLRSGSP